MACNEIPVIMTDSDDPFDTSKRIILIIIRYNDYGYKCILLITVQLFLPTLKNKFLKRLLRGGMRLSRMADSSRNTLKYLE